MFFLLIKVQIKFELCYTNIATSHQFLQQPFVGRFCSVSASLRPCPACAAGPSFFGSFLAKIKKIYKKMFLLLCLLLSAQCSGGRPEAHLSFLDLTMAEKSLKDFTGNH